MTQWRQMTDAQKRDIYEMHRLGEKADDIASAFGISLSTVYRIIRKQREEQTMSAPEPVAINPAPKITNKHERPEAYMLKLGDKVYGLYESLEKALSDEELMNGVLEFACVADRFELAEVQWR